MLTIAAATKFIGVPVRREKIGATLSIAQARRTIATPFDTTVAGIFDDDGFVVCIKKNFPIDAGVFAELRKPRIGFQKRCGHNNPRSVCLYVIVRA
jgi:hypothetical protein